MKLQVGGLPIREFIAWSRENGFTQHDVLYFLGCCGVVYPATVLSKLWSTATINQWCRPDNDTILAICRHRQFTRPLFDE